jgi:DNA-binding NtrC family response regulator
MKETDTILIVDDQADFRAVVRQALARDDFTVREAGSGREMATALEQGPLDLVLVDLVLQGESGLDLLKELCEFDSLLPVVIMTGHSSVETAVEAMRAGAYDYACKPMKLAELRLLVRRAVDHGKLLRQNRALRESSKRRPASPGGSTVVAASATMSEVFAVAAQAANSPLTLLITGETGVGKEVVAQHVHELGNRQLPMTVLDCGALAENLLNAELFGHERGAFTGAQEARPGVLEVADGSSLLLDEIDSVPLGAQSRLLRFLEDGTFRRVGASKPRRVNVRIIATTNQDLATLVQRGEFREDLYHRLMVLHIHVPPLRARRDDVLPLARRFLQRQGKAPEPALTAEAEQKLLGYHWPGNVRELLHTMERGAFLAHFNDSQEVTPHELQLTSTGSAAPPLSTLADARQQHIDYVLRHCQGNRREAARILGISERQLYRLIRPEA